MCNYVYSIDRINLEVQLRLNCVPRRESEWFGALEISIVKPSRCTIFKIYLFWNNTPHVCDGLSVHHQESKTVHTASGI